jgi:hypothetical protein
MRQSTLLDMRRNGGNVKTRDDLERAKSAKDNFYRFCIRLGIINSDGTRPQIIASQPIRSNGAWLRWMRQRNSSLTRNRGLNK